MVVTCPSIIATEGEMYDDTQCTNGSKLYNETCAVVCELGYNLTRSDNVHRCTENDTWTNDVTCERTSNCDLFFKLYLCDVGLIDIE